LRIAPAKAHAAGCSPAKENSHPVPLEWYQFDTLPEAKEKIADLIENGYYERAVECGSSENNDHYSFYDDPTSVMYTGW
jgi:hypothetical protein